MKLFVDAFELESPIGTVLAACDGRALCALDFGPPGRRLLPLLRARFGAGVTLRDADDPLGAVARARAWFAGDLEAFRGLPVDGGGTAFQRAVWAALQDVSPGATVSYGALARRVGAPAAARAVGAANGRNPVCIAVPCHRVVGAGGALTGYGGGLARKRWLLAHERARVDAARTAAPPW